MQAQPIESVATRIGLTCTSRRTCDANRRTTHRSYKTIHYHEYLTDLRVVYKANPLTGGYGIIRPGSGMNAAE